MSAVVEPAQQSVVRVGQVTGCGSAGFTDRHNIRGHRPTVLLAVTGSSESSELKVGIGGMSAWGEAARLVGPGAALKTGEGGGPLALGGGAAVASCLVDAGEVIDGVVACELRLVDLLRAGCGLIRGSMTTEGAWVVRGAWP
jgi:hypothetical protein